MKREYISPTVVLNGPIARETLSGSQKTPNEQQFKTSGAGSIGFYL